MELDLSSYFAASLGLMLLLFIIRVILYKTANVLRFGITGLYMFVILILIRGFLPFDFYKIKLTTSYYSRSFLPFLQRMISYNISIYGICLNIHKIMLVGLIIGSMRVLIKKVYGYYAFKRHINSLLFCCDSKVIQICEDVFCYIFPNKKEFNVKIVYSDMFKSPAIFVSSYPIIILPEISYTEEELKFVFYHELIHLKHRDFFVKRAADLLVAIYWWNPIIHKPLLYILNQVQELYVDYEVSKSLVKKDKVVYLNILSKTSSHICNDKNKKNIYALTGDSSLNMLQRLECIIDSRVNGLTCKGIIFSIIIFIFSFTFIFEPYSQPAYDEGGDKMEMKNHPTTYGMVLITNYI